MSTVKLETLLPRVSPHLMGCSREAQLDALASAASEFLGGSYLLRVDLDAADIESGESVYEVDVPTGMVMEQVLSVVIDERELEIVSDALQHPLEFVDEGPPLKVAMYNETSLKFYPTPDDDYTYTGVVVVKPSLTSTTLDAGVYETWGWAICYGALGHLLLIPGQPWTNETMAMVYRKEFIRQKDLARIRDNRGVARQVQMRPFA